MSYLGENKVFSKYKMDEQKKQADMKLGLESEDECLSIFRNVFDEHLCKTDTYSCMDYISPKTYIELKTRNCSSNAFNTIMIGKNKVEFSLKSKRKCVLAWRFTDGIYYYIVNKKDITNGDVFYAMGGRSDRGIDERKMVAYIKKELLIKMPILSPLDPLAEKHI
jgi:hypothetical protein